MLHLFIPTFLIYRHYPTLKYLIAFYMVFEISCWRISCWWIAFRRVAAAILTLSLPLIAFFVALIAIFPPVITRSSLLTTPCAVEFILNVPLPFIVRSAFEKITASTLLSSVARKSFEVTSLFSVPSAKLMNTLSARFCDRISPLFYIAQLLLVIALILASSSFASNGFVR